MTNSNNNAGGLGAVLKQLREEAQDGSALSARAPAFAAASAAADHQQAAGSGAAAALDSAQPPQSQQQQQPGPSQQQQQAQQQQPGQQQQEQGQLRAGSASEASAAGLERTASGRFTTTSDGYRKRTMSVRIDPEAAIDEERYIAGESK